MKLLVLSQEHFSIFYIVKYISLVAMDKTLLVFKLISLICSTFFAYALIFFLFYYLQEKLGPWAQKQDQVSLLQVTNPPKGVSSSCVGQITYKTCLQGRTDMNGWCLENATLLWVSKRLLMSLKFVINSHWWLCYVANFLSLSGGRRGCMVVGFTTNQCLLPLTF